MMARVFRERLVRRWELTVCVEIPTIRPARFVNWSGRRTFGDDRSLEHCYLVDDEGVAMPERIDTFLVPIMQMTRKDKALLNAGTFAKQATWKFRRDEHRTNLPASRI